MLENYNHAIIDLRKGLSRVENIRKLHGRSFYAWGLCTDDRGSNVSVAVTYYIDYLVITVCILYFNISKNILNIYITLYMKAYDSNIC